jgi:hypothetical protein
MFKIVASVVKPSISGGKRGCENYSRAAMLLMYVNFFSTDKNTDQKLYNYADINVHLN